MASRRLHRPAHGSAKKMRARASWSLLRLGPKDSLQQELVELRGWLHELLEVSMRISRRFGLATVHREVETLERVVLVWGARYIRWPYWWR